MKEEAYYGLTGEVIRAIEPYSEADPVALLKSPKMVKEKVLNQTDNNGIIYGAIEHNIWGNEIEQAR